MNPIEKKLRTIPTISSDLGWDLWMLRNITIPDAQDFIDPEQAEKRKSTQRRIFQARWKWLKEA